jgi:hypothetical protein
MRGLRSNSRKFKQEQILYLIHQAPHELFNALKINESKELNEKCPDTKTNPSSHTVAALAVESSLGTAPSLVLDTAFAFSVGRQREGICNESCTRAVDAGGRRSGRVEGMEDPYR